MKLQNIKKIAKDIGYNSIQSFIENFKKVVGYTPTEFKEKEIENIYLLEKEEQIVDRIIRMYGDTSKMTLETPVPMRIKYTSPNEDKYGQSFDLPYCQVNWQGTSSLQYVLKNFTARLKDENIASG